MSEERKRILKMLVEGTISAAEAEELLDALGNPADVRQSEARVGGPPKIKNAKYIYVKVQSSHDDNVDVRVPLGLVRAGMRFTTLIPPQAMDHINNAMREKGMTFDLNSIKPDDIEEFLKNLSDMEVNVKSKNGDTVRVYCGE